MGLRSVTSPAQGLAAGSEEVKLEERLYAMSSRILSNSTWLPEKKKCADCLIKALEPK